jgi:transcriptional regulator with PAS, ATPase and Fis domain
LILLVTFMAVVGMTGLLLGAVTTERWHAEERLRESEDRFRRVVEASPSALVMIDQTGRIALVNGRKNGPDFSSALVGTSRPGERSLSQKIDPSKQ